MRVALLSLLMIPAVVAQDVLEPVTVFAERVREGVPGERVWSEAEIAKFAPQTIDALLAQDPAFSLFRRQSALFGNPTGAGFSLRNIGASAASRSSLYLDGIPQNDPFGGWINWARYDPADLVRVRLAAPSQANSFGNLSPGGVAHLGSREIVANSARLTLSAGSQGYLRGGLSQDVVSRDERFRFRASIFGGRFDGFEVLEESQRGPIDTRADLQFQGISLRADWMLTELLELQSRFAYFEEERGNGTRLTGNDTENFDYSLRLLGEGARLDWQAQLYYQERQFASRFSAAADDRSSERLALDQFDVPGRGLGGGLTLDYEMDDRIRLLGGFDFRLLDGETNENAGTFRQRVAGGQQDIWGVFGVVDFEQSAASRFKATLRLDHWRQHDGSRVERAISDGRTLRAEEFATRDGWEPSFSLRWDRELSDLWDLDLSVGRSFRLPTLNELYRPFRVRSDVTEANPALEPERFTYLEAGLSFAPADQFDLRLGGFFYWIDDAIANVPVTDASEIARIFGSLPPGGAGQQRQNVERSEVYGVDASLRWSPAPKLDFSANLLWSNSCFRSSPGQPLLEDQSFAQAPSFAMTSQARYAVSDDLSVFAEIDYRGRVYDDLLEVRRLSEFWAMRAGATWQATDDLTLGLRVENLFDTKIVTGVANNGLVSIGQPRAFWLNATWQF